MATKQTSVAIKPEFLEKIEKSGEKKSDVINRALDKELNGFFTEAESDFILHCIDEVKEGFDKNLAKTIRRKL